MLRSSSVVVFLAAVAAAVVVLPAQGTVQPTLLQARADEAKDPARRAATAGVVAKVRPSVVWVAVEVDGPRGKFTLERASSGVVVDGAGLVATFSHLVREAEGAADKRLFVQLDDAENTRLPASVVQHDAATGLALLRVTPPAAGLVAVPLGPDRIGAGEPVVVLARPAGKEMLAFAGYSSAALSAVTLHGKEFAAGELAMTDTRNDERCDGAPVFDRNGALVGLYASEHVQRDKSEPTLDELKLPSFGVVVPVGCVRKAFAAQLPNAGKVEVAVAPSAAAVARVAPAVVSVWAGDGDWPALGGKDPGGVVRHQGLGSGVVLAKNGLVVCNAHVVGSGKVRIRLLDGRTFPAAVVKKNASNNLALLRAELPAGGTLPAATCQSDDAPLLGEVVLAVGNPIGTGVVVTGGVVSALRGRDGARIQADANLGNQNGGGAIVDVRGSVLGIGDAGAQDPIEMAFAMRGDRISTETNLSTFVSIARVRKTFAAELEDADPAESIRAAAPPSAADLAARQSALVAMVQKTKGALLNVYLAKNVAVQKEDDPFAPEPKWQPLSLGSGVVIDPSGIAISNWHVVDDATQPDGSMVKDHRVTVRTFDGTEYPVRVLSISREDDLSLLQLELPPGKLLPAVEFGSSDALAIGEPVAAIGNPHGAANTITFGVVTAKDQELRIRGRWAALKHLIETDAAINGGNSGGALLDMNGRLVGINSAGGGTFNNKGYAIAVDHVRNQLLGLLFAAYKLRSPDLGMRVLDADGKVSVLDVDPRGPAAKAGLAAGDRIVALGGTAITWSPGWALTLLHTPAGAPVALRYERDGKAAEVQVVPMPASVWAVVRQSGLAVRDFAFAEDEARVRAAAIGLHRAFTGDTTGEPGVIPERLVLVEKVYAGEQQAADTVQAGDLLLACELITEKQDALLVRIGSVDALRDLWNDRSLGNYDGLQWRCWVARGAEVKQVQVTSKRLFW
ncbi:MAG: trypsin-like peptidase domain-containing protein [Planctomycetes bacterium]|nr:trypsin-like peptidase domain-containing protein [Planctomycetota bacterium]